MDRKLRKNIHKLDKKMKRFVRSLSKWTRSNNGRKSRRRQR